MWLSCQRSSIYFAAGEGDYLSCQAAEQFNNGLIIIFQKSLKTSWTRPVKCFSVCAFCLQLSEGNHLIWHISEQRNNNISAWSFLIAGENKRLQAIHLADSLLWHRLLQALWGSADGVNGLQTFVPAADSLLLLHQSSLEQNTRRTTSWESADRSCPHACGSNQQHRVRRSRTSPPQWWSCAEKVQPSYRWAVSCRPIRGLQWQQVSAPQRGESVTASATMCDDWRTIWGFFMQQNVLSQREKLVISTCQCSFVTE